jgi:multidrug resistance efflux pump
MLCRADRAWIAAWFCAMVIGEAAGQEREPVPTPVPRAVVVEGRVESKSGVRNLAFGRGGRLIEVAAQAGHKVRRGQLLARLACGDVQEDLQLAEAELRVFRESYRRLRAGPSVLDLDITRERLALARADFDAAIVSRDRMQSLFERNGLVSKQDIELAERRVIVARLEVAIQQQAHDRTQLLVEASDREEAAGEDVRAAAIRRARQAVSMCEIRAPEEAVVLETFLRAGEAVASTTPVLTVVSDDPAMRGISAWVPVVDVVPVKVGQETRVRVPAVGDATFKATIVWMAASMTDSKAARVASSDTRQGIMIWIDASKALATAPLHAPAHIYLAP